MTIKTFTPKGGTEEYLVIENAPVSYSSLTRKVTDQLSGKEHYTISLDVPVAKMPKDWLPYAKYSKDKETFYIKFNYKVKITYSKALGTGESIKGYPTEVNIVLRKNEFSNKFGEFKNLSPVAICVNAVEYKGFDVDELGWDAVPDELSDEDLPF